MGSELGRRRKAWLKEEKEEINARLWMISSTRIAQEIDRIENDILQERRKNSPEAKRKAMWKRAHQKEEADDATK